MKYIFQAIVLMVIFIGIKWYSTVSSSPEEWCVAVSKERMECRFVGSLSVGMKNILNEE